MDTERAKGTQKRQTIQDLRSKLRAKEKDVKQLNEKINQCEDLEVRYKLMRDRNWSRTIVYELKQQIQNVENGVAKTG